MSDELKPCPFCGSSVTLGETIEEYTNILCDNGCRGNGLVTFFRECNRESAITAWNTRTDERAEMQAAIVELRLRLQAVIDGAVYADAEGLVYIDGNDCTFIEDEVKAAKETLENTKKWSD